jgi:predicted TIM-barrel fold metal-dependent hydrolase
MALEEIHKRNMPVVFEEEFENTVLFLDEIASGITVIIPHMGFLNGGYAGIDGQGLWSYKNVYADTSLASREEILHYINKYGSDKILFGSDFPFGSPKIELEKIMRLPLSENKIEAIIGGNLKRLLASSNL